MTADCSFSIIFIYNAYYIFFQFYLKTVTLYIPVDHPSVFFIDAGIYTVSVYLGQDMMRRPTRAAAKAAADKLGQRG